jgi:H+/Cl- antiporter ClcA
MQNHRLLFTGTGLKNTTALPLNYTTLPLVVSLSWRMRTVLNQWFGSWKTPTTQPAEITSSTMSRSNPSTSSVYHEEDDLEDEGDDSKPLLSQIKPSTLLQKRKQQQPPPHPSQLPLPSSSPSPSPSRHRRSLSSSTSSSPSPRRFYIPPQDNGINTHQYEEFESEIWKHHQLQRKFGTRGHCWSYENKRIFRKWTQTLLIGVLTGLVAYLVVYCTSHLMSYKFSTLYHLIALERIGQLHYGTGFLFFTSFNLFCSFIAWFTVYIAPAASGSGIPEVKSFLNGVNLNVLEAKTMVAKAIGIIFTVSGGLPAGKEGPMIHMGAGLAVLLSESSIVSGSLLGFDNTFRTYQDYHNDREKRDLVASGAAAGVAAAFGAPIGGVLFSLEEGASFWSTKLTWRCFFCAMTTVTTLFIIRTVNIHLGQANANAMFSFGQFYKLQVSVYNFSVFELPVFCLIGGLGGLLGAASNEANMRLHQWRMKSFIQNIYARLGEVLLISLLVSVLSFWIPVLM